MWEGGSQMKRGGPRKGEASGPPDPPSGHAYGMLLQADLKTCTTGSTFKTFASNEPAINTDVLTANGKLHKG